MKYFEPTDNRPEPPPPMEETLVAEYEHAARRMALAEKMLKEWRMSHGADTKPTSIYQSRGLRVLTDDDDNDLPGHWHTHTFTPEEPTR